MHGDFHDRLEKVESLVRDRREDVGKRTGVPFIVLTYPPNKEIEVDREIRSFIEKLEFRGQTVTAIDLRDLVFTLLEEQRILDGVIDVERRSPDDLHSGFKSALVEGEPMGKIASRIVEEASGADTVVIYRMGVLYPFASGSTLMGQLEGQTPTYEPEDGSGTRDVPIVLCYPASVDGNTLHFLNESEGTYYRANVI